VIQSQAWISSLSVRKSFSLLHHDHLPQTPGILGRWSSAKEKSSVFYLAIAWILLTNVMSKNRRPATWRMIAFASSILFGRALIALAAPR
jgi:hypothetical protein